MDEVCERKTSSKKSISDGWKRKKARGTIFSFFCSNAPMNLNIITLAYFLVSGPWNFHLIFKMFSAHLILIGQEIGKRC